MVGEELGLGGMGRVWRAEDRELRREVALKELRPELAAREEFRARFLREAQATGQLEHPNIVPLHDLGLSGDGTPYFTMKLVRGESLESVIARLSSGDAEAHRQFSFGRRLGIMREVCDALDYAHSRGVLHRDLKPSNVMLGPYGEVMVLDWGIARRLSEGLEEVSEGVSEPGRTEVGQFLGTLGHAAPEQMLGDPVDARADVYAVGVLMYHLLALRPPYAPSQDLVQRMLEEDPPTADQFLHPVQGRVPREVSRIIERAMHRDLSLRYGSAAELRKDLQDYLDGQAAVVCVPTGLKRGVYRLARWIDDYPFLMILLLTLLVMVPIVEAVVIFMLW